jgi:hypothetical protein
MTLLYDRRYTITVDTIQFTDLDCHFKVDKTLKPAPNNCEVTVYNLTEDHRAQLEQVTPKGKQPTRGIPCEIVAGYKDGVSQVWLGDLRTAHSTYEDHEWVTKLSAGDGEKGAAHARLQISYGPKTQIDVALRAMARAMGVGEGNLSKVVARLKMAGAAVFPTGVTISGPVYRQMQQWAQSADLQLSIQDNALQFIDIGKALQGEALKLTHDTGLREASVDNEGVLTAKIDMIPGVRMGGIVIVDSLTVKGQYQIQKGTCEGETDSTDTWGWTIQGKRY